MLFIHHQFISSHYDYLTDHAISDTKQLQEEYLVPAYSC